MRKIILGILISFGTFFLMSHNASAVTMVFDASQYTPVVRQVYNLVDCTFRQETSPVETVYKNGVSNCSLDQISLKVKLTKIVTSNSITFKKGDIVEFDVINYLGNYNNTGSYNTIDFSWNAFKLNDVNNFYMMGYDEVFYNTNSSGTQFGNVNAALRFRVYVNNDVYTPIGLYATDVTYNPIATWRQSSDGLKWNIINLTVYRKTGKSAVNEEQEQAANEAISDSESSSEENSSNAQTTNLIGALSGIFTTISGTSATNCNITGDLGAINMGALNLCQGKEHFNSLIEFIGFSALFVVVFWASYHLVRRTLGLIDWARSN